MARSSRALSAVVLLVLCGLARAADEPRVSNVSLSFAKRELRVSARLSPGLPLEVEKRLASGLPTTTRWEIELVAFRSFWRDSVKDARTYAVTATYRPGTLDYTIERRLDTRLLETFVVTSQVDASRALSTVPALPGFLMGSHLDGKTMAVKVRCAYAAEVSLGLVPTTAVTAVVVSEPFTWREESAR